MAASASDWLRHYQYLLWIRRMKLNQTWQEARIQRPLPSLCFSGRCVKKLAALSNLSKGGTLYSGARYVTLWPLVSYTHVKQQSTFVKIVFVWFFMWVRLLKYHYFECLTEKQTFVFCSVGLSVKFKYSNADSFLVTYMLPRSPWMSHVIVRC